MSFPLEIPAQLASSLPPGRSVLLGISGGVDSSLALALLDHLGCEVVTVTLKNFCTSDGAYGGDQASSCCSLDAIDAARRLSERFGVRHWVANVEDSFSAQVIAPFVDEYRNGRTPNPCVGCNTFVRFPEMLHRADQLGIDLIATGHYARHDERDGCSVLRRGCDLGKDQSYFLHGLDASLLSRCVFPLGWWNKTEVRAAAEALGITSARKPDSQEICFVPDDDRSFLFEAQDVVSGEIVDRDGCVLGRHRGLIHYTVGQRRGLGIAAAEPLYVLELDPRRNRLVVGFRHELRVGRIVCDGWRDSGRGLPLVVREGMTAQVRHRHGGIVVTAWQRRDASCEFELAVGAEGVSPGQFLVIYDGDEVLGGGRIVTTAAHSGGEES